MHYAYGRNCRIIVRGRAVDSGGMEDGQVRHVILLDSSTPGKMKAARGFIGDLVDSLGECEPATLPAHLSQQQGKGSVEARMRAAFHIKTVADDARERMRKRLAQIFFALIHLD